MPHKHDFQDAPQTPWLPFELVEVIAHAVRIDAEVREDNETIKACSLVSPDWTILFQRMLFEIKGLTATLAFSNGASDKQRGRTNMLCRLLDANPSFGKEISCLRLTMVDEEYIGNSKLALTVPSILSLLTGIKTLSISHLADGPDQQGGSIWSKFSRELQEAIAALIRSPTLKNLTIDSFDGPLAVLLPEGAEFDTLTLGTGITSPEFLNVPDNAVANTPDVSASTTLCIVHHLISNPRNAAKLMQATRQNSSTPMIDLPAVHSLNVTIFEESDVDDARAFFQRATNLNRLTVYFGMYAHFSLRDDQRAEYLILFPHMTGKDIQRGLFRWPQPTCLRRKVEELRIYTPQFKDRSPIGGLIQELEMYPQGNILKRITLEANFFSNVQPPPVPRRMKSTGYCLVDFFYNVSRFPTLQKVELAPTLPRGWESFLRDESDVMAFAKDFEEMEGMINLGGQLRISAIMKPRVGDLAPFPFWLEEEDMPCWVDDVNSTALNGRFIFHCYLVYMGDTIILLDPTSALRVGCASLWRDATSLRNPPHI